MHLPSIVTNFGIHVPPIFKIVAVGGTKDRDDIRVNGSVTLLVFAKLKGTEALTPPTSDAASSDNSAPSEVVEVSTPTAMPQPIPRDYEDLFADGDRSGSVPGVAGLPTAITARGNDGPGLGRRRDRATPEERRAGEPGRRHAPHEPYQPDHVAYAVPAPGPLAEQTDGPDCPVLFLVYAQDYVPEVLTVLLQLRCVRPGQTDLQIGFQSFMLCNLSPAPLSRFC